METSKSHNMLIHPCALLVAFYPERIVGGFMLVLNIPFHIVAGVWRDCVLVTIISGFILC